jgi:hypothetical protein
MPIAAPKNLHKMADEKAKYSELSRNYPNFYSLNLFLDIIVIIAAATCSRWFLARKFFYPEDGGDTILRNVGSHRNYTAPTT